MSIPTTDDEKQAIAMERRVRTTWLLMLASALPLYSLPLRYQLLYEEASKLHEINPAISSVVMDGAPTVDQWLYWWLPRAAPVFLALVLAAVGPRLLHRRWVSRQEIPLLLTAGENVATYRVLPPRHFVLHPSGKRRLARAYLAKLIAVGGLLMIANVFAYAIAYPLTGGHVTIYFAAVETYLPLFVLVTIVLLANAPTNGRMYRHYTANITNMAKSSVRD